MPLALDLRFDARQQFVSINRTHQIVVHTHIEAAQQPRLIAGLHQYDDGQVPRALEGAHLRAQSQSVGALQRQANDQQIKIAFRELGQCRMYVAFREGVISFREHLEQACGRARMVID